MKKQLLTSLLLLASGLTALAGPISPSQALARLNNSANRPMKAKALSEPALVYSTPGAYVFNTASEGYMILSADDTALPLLGYSDSGVFNPADIPPQMQWWLEQYDRQVAFASHNGTITEADAPAFSKTYEAIPPMVKAKWDQGAPFNDQCPLYGTERTYTGCVATAMAQVMDYWKYPERGKGSISYTAPSIEKKLSLNFALKKFDWPNMKDTYYDGYTEEQASAVAYLMKAAAYSVKMDFTTDASGALAMEVANSLVKYFDYDGNINYTLRDYYSSEQWADMLYENLRSVGPIIYGGGSYIGGGHSFVCDGYDGNGYFHFNWGWSGMSNGYFALDALAPGSLGAGGGSGGGYSFSQDAVLGIQPPTGQTVETKPLYITQMGSLTAALSGSSLTFDLTDSGEAMWVNYNPKTMLVSFGVIIEPQGETPGGTRYARVTDAKFQLQAGYGSGPSLFSPKLNLAALDLPDGSYKITFASFPISDEVPTAPTDQWIPVRANYGCFNYVTLTKNASAFSVANGQLPQLKISGEVVGELYAGLSSTWKVTVENLSDIEVTSGFAPCLAAEGLGAVLLGESICLTIPPHSTVTREWSTMLYQMQQFSISGPTQLGFTFFNENNYTFYDKIFLEEVTMLPSPDAAVIAFDKAPQVEGATIKETFTQSLQIIPDPSSIIITATPRLESGYFSYPMVCCLCSQGENGYVNIEAAAGQTVVIGTPGQTAEFRTELSYPVMKPKTTYYLVMAYEIAQGYVPFNTVNSVAQIRWNGQSDIEEIDAATAAPATVYDLQGRPVQNPARGIYIINGRKTLLP